MFNTLTQVNKDQVLSVYSGAHGCACGCLGNHRYRADAKLRALAAERRGYEISDDEVSERSVSFVVNKINKNWADAEVSGDMVVFETETRVYIAYLISEEN